MSSYTPVQPYTDKAEKPRLISLQFKRLPVGVKFTHKGTNFKKLDGKSARELLANGVGRTHVSVQFSRSAQIEALAFRG